MTQVSLPPVRTGSTRVLLGTTVAVALMLCGCGAQSAPTRAAQEAAPSAEVQHSRGGVPPQSRGRYGVTWRILNWNRYGSDPAVGAYKRAFEAFAGSLNKRRLEPDLGRLFGPGFMRYILSTFPEAFRSGWHTHDSGYVRVVGVTHRGNQATLLACNWQPSTDVYDGRDKPVGPIAQRWVKRRVSLSRVRGRYLVETLDEDLGTCPGKAPR